MPARRPPPSQVAAGAAPQARSASRREGIPEPDHACGICPRLTEFRAANRSSEQSWFNAPVPSFGSDDARLLVVGLAPGLKGANRTGRPFTGDYAGVLLYQTLLLHGLARGAYDARPDDGLELVDCMITNAVRCVPPENKPTPEEVRACNHFLATRLAAMPRLAVIVALGRIAHDATLTGLGLKRTAYPFAHGARHALRPGLTLFDSFHCSRYNTNTGRLTSSMFEAVFAAARNELSAGSAPP